MYLLLFQIERFYMYFLLFWLLEIRCELLSNPLLVQLELVLASQLFLIAGLKYWGPEIFIKGFVKCAKDQILSAQTTKWLNGWYLVFWVASNETLTAIKPENVPRKIKRLRGIRELCCEKYSKTFLFKN